MWFLRFESDDVHARFIELTLHEGVVFKRGPYNFAALAHDDGAIDTIERAAATAFATLAREAA
jgi:hypothetical protein